jgi:cytochrome o ubiquinol oxidase subunit 3
MKNYHHELAERAATENLTFGFWLYIMSDCLIFASLFITYIVLQNQTFGGPSIADITNLPYVLTETFILLTSSFTAGLGILAILNRRPRRGAAWFTLTLTLGLAFLTMELAEFHTLITEDHTWKISAFMSAYFTLVGTHGLHVAFGSLWMFILIVMLLTRGYSEVMKRRLIALSIFWHFLDVIWIFIFTFVYLLGVA